MPSSAPLATACSFHSCSPFPGAFSAWLVDEVKVEGSKEGAG